MTGEPDDMLARLKLVLPARWFGDVTPVLDAVLTGLASTWSNLYALLANVRLQAQRAIISGQGSSAGRPKAMQLTVRASAPICWHLAQHALGLLHHLSILLAVNRLFLKR